MDILHSNEECEPRGEGSFVCGSCRRKLLKNEIVKNRFGERLCEKNASVVFLLKGNILFSSVNFLPLAKANVAVC